jgi:hypothetical protein
MFDMNGKLPSKVFKAYDNPDYASALVNDGQIRLGIQQSYQNIEDENRVDGSEGEGKLIIRSENITTLHINPETNKLVKETSAPGDIHRSSTYLNPCYIFSVSGPNVNQSYHQKQFGDNRVEIFDTSAFHSEIEKSLKTYPLEDGRTVADLIICEVRYDKGEIGDYPSENAIPLSVLQKPPSFKADCEWRVVVVLSSPLEGPPDALLLNLANSHKFCKIING